MKRPVPIVAAAIFLTTHAANLQIPLYGTYAKMADFGSGISAIAFSTYVAGLLPTLILLGGVSERIGRKTVMLASLCCTSVATFLPIAQPTIYTLFVTRILQGIGVGLITGTGTAYLSTLMPQNASKVAAYVSLTTALGFSSGALFTNAALSYRNLLVPFSYWGVLVQPIARQMAARKSLQIGAISMVLGYVTFTWGAWLGSLNLVLAGVAIAGTACYGFTYLGGLAQVVQLGGDRAARVTSGYFICAYLGYGIPLIPIGFCAECFGILNTLAGFGAILLVGNLLVIAASQRLDPAEK